MSTKSICKRRRYTGGWPPERRKAAAARCRAHKPWQYATGPKTMAGKRRVRLNALKHGNTGAHWRRLRRALRSHREFLSKINEYLENDLAKYRPPVKERSYQNMLLKFYAPKGTTMI